MDSATDPGTGPDFASLAERLSESLFKDRPNPGVEPDAEKVPPVDVADAESGPGDIGFVAVWRSALINSRKRYAVPKQRTLWWWVASTAVISVIALTTTVVVMSGSRLSSDPERLPGEKSQSSDGHSGLVLGGDAALPFGPSAGTGSATADVSSKSQSTPGAKGTPVGKDRPGAGVSGPARSASSGSDSSDTSDSAAAGSESSGTTRRGGGSGATTPGLTKVSQVTKVGLLTGADFPSGKTIAIASKENGKFVTAEVGYTGSSAGMLRAASSTASGFTLVWHSSAGAWSIRSTTGSKYVSDQDTAGSEVDWGASSQDAMLAANTTAAGPWEMFELLRYDDGTYSFRGKASGLIIAAELNYSGASYGMLRSRSTGDGSWERFSIT